MHDISYTINYVNIGDINDKTWVDMILKLKFLGKLVKKILSKFEEGTFRF